MQFQFSFKHMQVSESLKSYTEGKVKSLVKKFVTKPIEAKITFSVDKHRHEAHLALMGGDGFLVQVDHACSDMYGSVDIVLQKLAAQLKKKKDRLKKHKGNRNIRSMRFADPDSIDYQVAEVDASDIVAFEEARRRRAS